MKDLAWKSTAREYATKVHATADDFYDMDVNGGGYVDLQVRRVPPAAPSRLAALATALHHRLLPFSRAFAHKKGEGARALSHHLTRPAAGLAKRF